MRHSAIVAAALLLMACSRGDDSRSDTAAGTVSPAGTASDTGAARTDSATAATAAGGTRAGATASGATGTATNQTQSGVTNARTGASTLGPGVKQLEPTGGRRTVNAEQGVVRDTLRVRKTP